jgi:hypothetical protein
MSTVCSTVQPRDTNIATQSTSSSSKQLGHGSLTINKRVTIKLIHRPTPEHESPLPNKRLKSNSPEGHSTVAAIPDDIGHNAEDDHESKYSTTEDLERWRDELWRLTISKEFRALLHG